MPPDDLSDWFKRDFFHAPGERSFMYLRRKEDGPRDERHLDRIEEHMQPASFAERYPEAVQRAYLLGWKAASAGVGNGVRALVAEGIAVVNDTLAAYIQGYKDSTLLERRR